MDPVILKINQKGFKKDPAALGLRNEFRGKNGLAKKSECANPS